MKTFEQFVAKNESTEAIHLPKVFTMEKVKKRGRGEKGGDAKPHQDTAVSVIDSIRLDLASLYTWIDGRMKRLGDELHKEPEDRTFREFAQKLSNDSLRHEDLHTLSLFKRFGQCKPQAISEENKRSNQVAAGLARQIFARTKQLRWEVMEDPTAEGTDRHVASICLGLSAMMILVLSEVTSDPQLAAYARVQLSA